VAEHDGHDGAGGPNGAGSFGAEPANGDTGNGHRKTFEGSGFGTLMLRVAGGPKETPPVASTRAYLRNGLPSLYQDGDFGMRFVGALEELLDPIVAVLDGLPAHFDPNHAPEDILELLAAWLGVDLDESQEIRHQREMVRRAAELGRRRGTVKGLELALALHFPELPMRVEDNGGVFYETRPAPADARGSSFVVYCDRPVEENVQAGIARCIEQYKPVHSTYRLRVKAAKKKVQT
jgi:phage tail-like protein